MHARHVRHAACSRAFIAEETRSVKEGTLHWSLREDTAATKLAAAKLRQRVECLLREARYELYQPGERAKSAMG